MNKTDILWCAAGYILSIAASWWAGYNSGHRQGMIDTIRPESEPDATR